VWSRVEFPDLNGWIEILCLAVIFYYLFFFLKGTRGTPVLTGLVLLFIGIIMLTRLIHLDALNWLLGRFSVYLVIAVLIIFQPEIRRALAELGKQHLFGNVLSNETMVDQIVEATTYLARRKIGALIAIEQAIGTRPFQETGIELDSAVTSELLANVFSPNAPLHDGGVIIAGNRIVAARCMFPLSERDEFSKSLGTRHRAAVGLSYETDAVVVVVSEETGMISVSHAGRLVQNLDDDHLRHFLSGLLLHARKVDYRWEHLQSQARQGLLWVRHRLWRRNERG